MWSALEALTLANWTVLVVPTSWPILKVKVFAVLPSNEPAPVTVTPTPLAIENGFSNPSAPLAPCWATEILTSLVC